MYDSTHFFDGFVVVTGGSVTTCTGGGAATAGAAAGAGTVTGAAAGAAAGADTGADTGADAGGDGAAGDVDATGAFGDGAVDAPPDDRPLLGVLLLRIVEVVPDEDATVGAAVVAELAAWSCWFAQATTLAAYARA